VICGESFAFSTRQKRAGQPGRCCSSRCKGVWQQRQPRKSTSRNSADYKEWRAAVYRRDDFTCQRCRKRGGHDLHAHHVKGWTRYPALRFDVSNGMTLCNPCHVAWHQEHGWR
jgi:5-methylcytosine-specific restriction endonuclease McrA